MVLQKSTHQKQIERKTSAPIVQRQKSLSQAKPQQVTKIVAPTKPLISKTVLRWFNLNMTGEELNQQILAQQIKFRKYLPNIFALHRAALKIQHWFFGLRQ
jgi:hypothetical protein